MSGTAVVTCLIVATYVALVGVKLRAVARPGKRYRRTSARRGTNLKRRAAR